MRKKVVFTDMDGTLLDHDTFSIRLAVASIDLLIRRGFPVVPVSSKTASEIRRWMRILFIKGPFICENGCGIFIPEGYFGTLPEGAVESAEGWKIPLAAGIDVVRGKLREAARESGVVYRGFEKMSGEEISRYSGLRGDELRACRQREYDEPFILERNGEIEKLRVPAKRKGLVLTRGGRFHHAADGCDKGGAVRILSNLFREKDPEILTVAVGDSQNDLAMLQVVDKGYLVKKADGTYDPEVLEKTVTRVQGIGPKGFRTVVEEIINFG